MEAVHGGLCVSHNNKEHFVQKYDENLTTSTMEDNSPPCRVKSYVQRTPVARILSQSKVCHRHAPNINLSCILYISFKWDNVIYCEAKLCHRPKETNFWHSRIVFFFGVQSLTVQNSLIFYVRTFRFSLTPHVFMISVLWSWRRK